MTVTYGATDTHQAKLDELIEYLFTLRGPELAVAAQYSLLCDNISNSDVVYTPEQVVISFAMYAGSQSLMPREDIHPDSEQAQLISVHDEILHMIYGDMPVKKVYVDAQCLWSNLRVFIKYGCDIDPAENRYEAACALSLINIAKTPQHLAYSCAFRRFKGMTVGKRRNVKRDIYHVLGALVEEHRYIISRKRDFMSEIAVDTEARDALFTVYSLMTREVEHE
jgi:hypothetical protein